MKKYLQDSTMERSHLFFVLTIILFWFSNYIYVPTFTLYLEHVQFSTLTIGILLASYGISQVLLRFPLGVWASRYPKFQIMFFRSSFIFAFFSSFLLIVSNSFTSVFLARFMIGISASMWVMVTVLYATFFSTKHLAKAMGFVQFLTITTQLVCMSMTGYMVHYFGWKIPFILALMSTIAGLYCMMQIQFPPVTKTQKGSLKVLIERILHHRDTWRSGVISLLGHALLFITIFGYSIPYATTLGVGEQAMIWVVLSFFLPHSLGAFVLMRFDLSLKQRSRILIGCFVSIAFAFILLASTTSLWIFYVAHIVIGGALGPVFPLTLAGAIETVEPDIKMGAMGLFQSFYAFGIVLGPLLASVFLRGEQYESVFVFCFVLALVALLILIMRSFRRERI